MKESVTLLIADDHEMIRAGIRHIISGHPNIKIIGEAANGCEAVKLAKELKPDVILLDLVMPGLNGIQACSLIIAAQPAARVIIFSLHEKESYAHQVLSVGACGYIVKTASGEELIEAIEKAASGQFYFSPQIGSDIIRKYLHPNQQKAENELKYDLLTDREQQIFRLVVEGFSSREIGEQIFISPRTVDKHRSNIMKKLGIKDSFELVRYAVKVGIIDPDLWCQQ